ncbi:MAG TPA: furin-like repeat-containing protein [Phycisphaerae bacterium]|nr:furin-like repeat-containing protein [Phycisphaerae bacterium]HRW54868.1 furin-like repeat-containing protein [Phycisphaerae bacterium]
MTRYIYRHYRDLLTAEERVAERIMQIRAKQAVYDPEGTRLLQRFRAPELEATYPALMQRIKAHGAAEVMRKAAERVIRDHSDRDLLNTCPKCDALCRTPKAMQCFSCGHDWHFPGHAV